MRYGVDVFFEMQFLFAFAFALVSFFFFCLVRIRLFVDFSYSFLLASEMAPVIFNVSYILLYY
jgi:hypothetical protein